MYYSLYFYKAYYCMHGCKPHEKIVTMHDFSLVRIPPGNLLEISAAGTGLISICTFIFCEASASPAGGGKIHQTSHPKPREHGEQYVVNEAGESSQKEDLLFISHFHWTGSHAEASTTGQREMGERTQGRELKGYLLLWEDSKRRWNRSDVRKEMQWVMNWGWGLVDSHFKTICWVHPMDFRRHFPKHMSRQMKSLSSRRN